eukprot:scaffold1172_cov144-Skeletonema_menzelii.AAC.4
MAWVILGQMANRVRRAPPDPTAFTDLGPRGPTTYHSTRLYFVFVRVPPIFYNPPLHHSSLSSTSASPRIMESVSPLYSYYFSVAFM